MLFFANTHLMFYVNVGGVNLMVEFSEAGQGVPNTFRTNDAMVIDAIRKHKFYRQGRITERMEESDLKKTDPTQDPTRPPLGEEVDKKAASNANAVVPDEVLEFNSYTALKAYLKKTYKDDEAVHRIKTPVQVKNYAQSKGVAFRIV